ncbi:MAG: hypothetical protein H6573_29295 [Lewinellaceae bacterium]|jgi:hypothetical protein|nr:hypothetical protein [Phaeodactylibacter sp.]MCB0612585.1 hypothetical protein [Phaeodactylibacter sp.]MCB9351564.1 hypothetical protein [Lewinellaceae bacterium]
MVLSDDSLQAVHFEHRLWVNELNFFADELKIYEHQLEELVTKADRKEAMQELEQFQNQFIRQKEVLDALQHDIHIHEQKLSEAVQEQQKLPLDPEYHNFLKEQMESFRSIYAELKKRFYLFLNKWR